MERVVKSFDFGGAPEKGEVSDRKIITACAEQQVTYLGSSKQWRESRIGGRAAPGTSQALSEQQQCLPDVDSLATFSQVDEYSLYLFIFSR